MTTPTVKLITGLLLFSLFASAQAATLTSTVNRNPIKINQTLTLTVRYTDAAPSSELDMSGLNQDFEILASSPSTNSSVSIINGDTTRETAKTWTITLAAKSEGELTIPAFEIDGTRSEPITVMVSALTAAELAQPQPIEVNVTIDDADNLSIKPGEQIIVEVELSAALQVGNIRGQELLIAGAELESLGQQDGQRLENGVARQVAVWRYALFPNNAGEIIVPAQTFEGSIGGRRSSFFDTFSRGGEPVGARSVQQTIIVDERPDTEGKAWFPANNVQIESTWASDTSQIKAGEPITRTITITAIGQRASAIPPLGTSTSSEYKSYQDQPQLEDAPSNQGIIGVRRESQAIVPSQAGELTLPEQRISWWDNAADQWREAILPAETFAVLAGNNSIANPAAPAPQAIDPGIASNNEITANNISLAPQDNQDWLWRISTLLLAGLVLWQFYLLRKQNGTKAAGRNSGESTIQINETAAWNKLQRSIQEQEPTQIRNTILQWAQISLPKNRISSLDSLAYFGQSKALREQLNALDKQLYGGGDDSDFDQNALQTALMELRENIKQNKRHNHSPSELKPLYPV